MHAECRRYPFFLAGLPVSLLLGACSSSETRQLTVNELRSKYGLEICAGSKALPRHKPMIAARVVVFEVPRDECKANFFNSLERAAESWEHPYGDRNRMQGVLADGPLFLAQGEAPRQIFIMITNP